MATDYEKFVGKKVVLVQLLDKPNEKGEGAEELEGTLEAVAGEMVMFKQKGKTSPTLIETSKIDNIDYAPEKAKNLTARKLKPVEFGQARAHLLDRHGMTLAQVNELSEKDAFETHEKIDHDGLGHVHEAVTKPEDASDDE
jgi:hypothetical protein